LLSPNIIAKYDTAVLKVLPAELAIRALDTTINYGNTISNFRYTIEGYQYQDADSNLLSTAPSFSVLNTSNSEVTGVYPAGNYSIQPGNASLVQPTNYKLVYQKGKLTVSTIPLIVKANDAVIFAGDPLPSFSSTITGFVNGDSLKISSGPTYIVNGYSGSAGTYTIIPGNLQLPNIASYNVDYRNGILYVNPKGKGAKNVKPSLDCVDTLMNDPSGYSYVARFRYTNDNKSIVYIPIGPDNEIISASGYAGRQPEIFYPGTATFEIKFKGDRLSWILQTYNVNQKTSVGSDASSSSNKCKAQTSTFNRMESQEEFVTNNATIYPNPVRQTLRIKLASGILSTQDTRIFNASGIEQKINTPGRISESVIELNVSHLTKGVYFIRVRTREGYTVCRINKL
jgi:hypothetical protein